MKDDLYFMQEALLQAEIAQDQGEVPVGAVLTFNNEIVSRAHNTSIRSGDPSAHAEVNVIRDAAKKLNNYRLKGTSLYVTLEPCIMCYGAIYWSKIKTIVYGASDLKRGFSSQTVNVDRDIKIIKGVLEAESKELLDSFFKKIRD